MERADLQATSFAGNIDTVHIMLNFENKYLHIQCFLGIFACEKHVNIGSAFLQLWLPPFLNSAEHFYCTADNP